MLNKYQVEQVAISCDRCGAAGERQASLDAATSAATGWYVYAKTSPPQVPADVVCLCPDCLTAVKAA